MTDYDDADTAVTMRGWETIREAEASVAETSRQLTARRHLARSRLAVTLVGLLTPDEWEDLLSRMGDSDRQQFPRLILDAGFAPHLDPEGFGPGGGAP